MGVFGFGGRDEETRDGFQWSDDAMLKKRMRELAVRLRVDGRARLLLSRRIPEEMNRLAGEIARAVSHSAAPTEVMDRLSQDARILETLCTQSRLDGGARLPACGGVPRILRVMREMTLSGDMCVDRERLILALEAFDDVQSLTMAEIWAAPTALRIALSEGCVRLARVVCAMAKERAEAEKWVTAGGRVTQPKQAGSAFIERAVQLTVERELPEMRAALEEMLARRDESAEKLIRNEHEAQALYSLRLSNLVSAKRMLDAIIWRKCFRELSRTERELLLDPAGVYGKMDEESCAAIRDQVAHLAEKLNLGETTIAHQAVTAARAANREYGEDDVRANVCWWLYDDEGVLQLANRLGVRKKGVKKRVPDPSGKLYMLLSLVVFAVILAGYVLLVDDLRMLLLGIPLSWGVVKMLSCRLIPRLFPPRRLLKLAGEDERGRPRAPESTLVVVPALLSSVKRAQALCDNLETLGCLDADENVRYLLLGDFRDADSETEPEDAEILEAVRGRVRDMNARAGGEKYLYLHRNRVFYARDRRWMGCERKRGALMALNRVLLGVPRAQEAFRAEEAACMQIRNRFAFVLTLDADTRILPGTVQKLSGALAHPLNRPHMLDGRRRGYAILQPNMELAARACVNRFVQLFAGDGGVDAYPVSVSNLYQDLTGRGSFGGKGIYDVRAFMEALEGALPDGRVLSHDLLEGELARTGFVSDVSMYDGFPETLSKYLLRLNRWTRGDWQLLPYIFSGRWFSRAAGRLSLLSRWKLLDNLLSSLYSPSLIALLIQGIWFSSPSAFALGVLLAFLPPVFCGLSMRGDDWRRAIVSLAILPAKVGAEMDAILRTLFRLAFTKKHMLDWVTSADATAGGLKVGTACRVVSILLIPGLFIPAWVPASLALGAIFLVAPGYVRDLQNTPVDARGPLTSRQIGALHTLALATWRFFENSVTHLENHLPPDNVQIDPPIGAARRTSPTNIGLYLLSLIAARELGFLRDAEMVQRLRDTLFSVERLETWNGQLYNWYDIDSLQPLRPRYVSSVDSGNLAACLLVCCEAVRGIDAALSDRLCALAERMDFSALYDGDRNLFRIGVDVEHERAGQSHYDLLASESRILSYVAMMLGQVPTAHWKALARTMVRLGEGQALVSWSGTMFEYLMPELFMHAPATTLLGETNRGIVRTQIQAGEEAGRPWGVSESGYYAFDMHLNYQYRAFGLRELALSGGTAQQVVAPYASVLALSVAPGWAADNIIAMRESGFAGEFGLYEAADYLAAKDSRADGQEMCLVKSYMAHHQGMTLCALANALCGDILVRYFEEIPQARALSLLLEEKPSPRVRLKKRFEMALRHQPSVRPQERTYRIARAHSRLVDSHLLFGAGAGVFLTARGDAAYVRNGVQMNRFSGDLLARREGLQLHLRDLESGRAISLTAPEEGAECVLDAGWARYTTRLGNLLCTLTMCVSPEDGALFQILSIRNNSPRRVQLQLTSLFAVALARPADFHAHPAFQKLFVSSRREGTRALVSFRRPGAPGGHEMQLLHLLGGAEMESWETDLSKLVGRLGNLVDPDSGIQLTNALGNTLDPCSAIRTQICVEPGQETEVHFAMGLVREGEIRSWIEKNSSRMAPGRALQLSRTQARAMLGFAGVNNEAHSLLQRASAFLFDPRLRERAVRAQPSPRPELWTMGISGDLPILTVYIADQSRLAVAREAVRAHEFYRTMGVFVDLVLVNDYGNDYEQPVRDALTDLMAASHLRDCVGMPAGAYLLDGQKLTDEQRTALSRASALEISGSGFYAQLRDALKALEFPRPADNRAMEPAEEGPKPEQREFFNGYGGFLTDREAYQIDVSDRRLPPAPWANVLAGESLSAIVTERGGGFIFGKNSRLKRLTPFVNDALWEGWGWMAYLTDEKRGTFARLLPGDRPMTEFVVTHGVEDSRFESAARDVKFSTTLYVHPEQPALIVEVALENTAGRPAEYGVTLFVDWLLGADPQDAALLSAWVEKDCLLAAGAMDGIGYLALLDGPAQAGARRAAFLGHGGVMRPDGLFSKRSGAGGWALKGRLALGSGEKGHLRFAMGTAESAADAHARIEALRMDADAHERLQARWGDFLDHVRISTPDPALNRMFNAFLPKQVLASRILARAGFYQAGGAYGFRDQLQDMLSMLPYAPQMVRRHLLLAAERQFEEGDVLHWWHMPYTGVRTRISDDCLFLPYVLAHYINETGDRSILFEEVPFLAGVEIPQGQEDLYFTAERSGRVADLHEHCMRAFRKASQVGAHGLARMGSGDWNDGMNRVGVEGAGESVWLTEFLSACAAEYAEICPSEEDRAWLNALVAQMNAAVEEFGWDGRWYLRAYFDDGEKLGSAAGQVCRIDAIAQAWAALAGLSPERVESALESAWAFLADERAGLIRLLAPPFDGACKNPGYIMAYPPGVRENGGQYTHGACWLLLAYIRRGDAVYAHRALNMLNPVNHARTRAEADVYKVEPYAVAADVYAVEPHCGRGGWTWYTGAAGWMLNCVLAILGYERRENRVKLCALLGDWPEAAITVRFGKSAYTLVSERAAKGVSLDGRTIEGEWIELVDDGQPHRAVFPPRNTDTRPPEEPARTHENMDMGIC